MKKEACMRAGIYLLGIVVLALGVAANTFTGLGVSAVVSVPYSISVIWELPLGTVTFGYYCVCVALQFLIGRRFCRPALLALQIPMALVSSVLIGWFSAALPFAPQTALEQYALLALAILLTGVGGAMIVDMALVPNPADALADVIGKAMGKSFGFGKNVLDALAVVLTCTIGVLTVHRVVGVQVGTLCCAVLIGRTIAAFNHFFRAPLLRAAGLDAEDRKDGR
ncbi:YitT family protein [uncultured Oscillibacter sp.]|uniref:YczE/YyaS/YitT family protein n=1 Tax=uncultured Oscillibacter sp. TaxID=876091 RepID=UPI0025D9E186|nr:DUF6198 family protein [uncultured Oscillibacter sp.]